MKKFCAAIFLPVLFLIAFVNANSFAVQKIEVSSSIPKKPGAGFKVASNNPDAEIERNISNNYTASADHGLQKIPCHLAVNAKVAFISLVLFSPATVSKIELFDNTSLSHNYPSHNFW